MIDGVNDEYAVSVGNVMRARNEYDAACIASGAESPEALAAKERLTESIAARDLQRTAHTAAESGRSRERHG